MLRVRFKANEDDYRPVNFPVKHPYWCSGGGIGFSTVISYADNESYIYENWPEATDLDSTEVDDYKFSERFPKPDWFNDTRVKMRKCSYCGWVLSDEQYISAQYDYKCPKCRTSFTKFSSFKIGE